MKTPNHQYSNYFNWLKREIAGKESIEAIYDDLIKENIYDKTIEYDKRVMDFIEIFQNLSIKPRKILDLGCGTGAFIEAIQNKNSAKIVGVDLSSGMLGVAKKRFANYKNISFLRKDFMQLSFPKDSFDLITMGYSSRFIPKKREEEFMKKVDEWLTPEGRFVVALFQSPLDMGMVFLSNLTGRPKGFNQAMNTKRYFIKHARNHLVLEKTLSLRYKFIAFEAVALFLERKFKV